MKGKNKTKKIYFVVSNLELMDISALGDLTQAGTQKLGRITDEVNALVK